jgi:LPS export ABC transporter permease LptF/LPS export ABC transporter permease LptG
MRLTDRTLLREATGYAGLGLGVFLFILLTPEVLRLSELLARENIAFSHMGQLFLSVFPEKLLWAAPLGVLAGLLMAVSRSAADCEILALKAAGVNPLRLLRPALAFAALGAALTLATSLWWLPHAARTVRQLQSQVAPAQISYDIKPRVFDERFPELILYTQDTTSGGAEWQGVFLADVSRANQPEITLAESAVLLPEPERGRLRLRLANGSTHSYVPAEPQRYSMSTFAESDLNINLPEQAPSLRVRHHADLSLAELWAASQEGDNWRAARADFHRRLVLPAACLVFGFVALPLGLLAERTGRAVGFVAAVAVAIAYYLLFLFGDRLGREGGLPPGLGVWLANLVLLFSVPLYFQLDTRGWGERLGQAAGGARRALASFLRRSKLATSAPATPEAALATPAGPNGWRLPFTLDLYVAREVLFYSCLLTVGLLLVFGLFTVMEMLDDIAANQAPWSLVLRFLWSLLPQAFYTMAPLALLIGILVAMALLSKRNELVAIKGAGISLYRIALPVVLCGLGVAGLLFWLDNAYLPQANQQQEILRNQIRGRPPQTFRFAERHWVFGEQPRIYHYSFFDPSAGLLAELNVLELSTEGFSLRRRLYAARARWNRHLQSWVLEEGWERVFHTDRRVEFRPFLIATFPELKEPPSYFRREIRESEQMNWRQLGGYIRELQQSGFEVTQLSVQWHRKFAFPLVAAIIALVAFPFGSTLGQRGALWGLALGIGLGFFYWVLAGFFGALGNLALLPPILAAWGPDLIFSFGGIYLFLHIDT